MGSGPRPETPAPPSAFDRAVRLLTLRPHFRAELERKLRQKGHDPDEIEEAIARLERTGALDDEALARREVERLGDGRGYGRARILAALGRKGAPRDAVEAALDAGDDDSELERALEAGRRWAARNRPDRSKLARHLERRGFAGGVIFRVLNELTPGDGSPEDFD